MLLLTVQNFDSIVYDSSCPVIVMFYADWCSKCAMMKPVYESLEKRYHHQITFCKLNIETASSIWEIYNTDIVPTFVFFKNGQIEAVFSGILDESVFDSRLKKIF